MYEFFSDRLIERLSEFKYSGSISGWHDNMYDKIKNYQSEFNIVLNTDVSIGVINEILELFNNRFAGFKFEADIYHYGYLIRFIETETDEDAFYD